MILRCAWMPSRAARLRRQEDQKENNLLTQT
jgi:hypothetical protein